MTSIASAFSVVGGGDYPTDFALELCLCGGEGYWFGQW
jgi:hypothetical protein